MTFGYGGHGSQRSLRSDAHRTVQSPPFWFFCHKGMGNVSSSGFQGSMPAYHSLQPLPCQASITFLVLSCNCPRLRFPSLHMGGWNGGLANWEQVDHYSAFLGWSVLILFPVRNSATHGRILVEIITFFLFSVPAFCHMPNWRDWDNGPLTLPWSGAGLYALVTQPRACTLHDPILWPPPSPEDGNLHSLEQMTYASKTQKST